MSDLVSLQGVVLSSIPVGEYDRRIVLLTRERGKIAMFAKGARRMGSPFLAAARPFVFGRFWAYEGRSSYSLSRAEVDHHFAELASMQPEVFYGYYFLEVADYFGREGIDEKDMMNLLYLAILALQKPSIDNRLIRCIFELRTLTVQGMMPVLFNCAVCEKEPDLTDGWFFSGNGHGLCCPQCAARFTGTSDTFRKASGKSRSDLRLLSGMTLRVLQYIAATPMERLFNFRLNAQTLDDIMKIICPYFAAATDRKFRSLEVLELMDGKK